MSSLTHALWDFRSLRFRMIAAVNGVLFIAVGVYLYHDYTRVLKERITERRIALTEEAKTLLPGIVQLASGNPDAIQAYIDDVCGRMSTSDSPGHHIVVEIGTQTWQARSHHRQSSEILASMRRAATRPDGRSSTDPFDLVVGSAHDGKTRVLVSEKVADIRHAAQRNEMRKIQAVILLVLIEAATINFVLVRMVSKPLDRLIGRLRAVAEQDFSAPTPRFSSSEMDTLAKEIGVMSRTLDRLEQQRRVQLKKAHAIQQALLPRHLDRVAGLRIAHLYHAAEEVGGDYFDLLAPESGIHLLSLGDATGHGVPAAMSAAMLKVLIQIASEKLRSPASILEWVNRRFIQVQLDGDFATLVVIRVDHREGTVAYANAGHDPAWLLNGNQPVELLATGPPLGIGVEFAWEERQLALPCPCRIAVSTDGITETSDESGQLFGRDRLLNTLLACQSRSPEETVKTVWDQVSQFRSASTWADDLTLVIADWDGHCAPADDLAESGRGDNDATGSSRQD